MLYQFDTKDPVSATAALLVYATYRSRDQSRFKITVELWGQIERFTKASAKRAKNIPIFLEALMVRLSCPAINPATLWPATLLDINEQSNHQAVIFSLYQETVWIILLVRDRLERERAIKKEKEEETT